MNVLKFHTFKNHTRADSFYTYLFISFVRLNGRQTFEIMCMKFYFYQTYLQHKRDGQFWRGFVDTDYLSNVTL